MILTKTSYSVGGDDGSGPALNAQRFLVFLWVIIYPKNKTRKNKRKGALF